MLMRIHNTAVFLYADPVDSGRIVFGLSLELLVFMYHNTAVFLYTDPVDNGRIVFGLSLELLVFMYQSCRNPGMPLSCNLKYFQTICSFMLIVFM